MQQLSPGIWKTIVVIGVVLILALPLLLIFIRQPVIFIQLHSLLGGTAKPITLTRYIVSSDVPGYTAVLVDSQYLDYMTAKLDVFGNQRIVDPHMYQSSPWQTAHATVSSIHFVLVPDVANPITVITPPSQSGVFVGKGDYEVNGATLVVHVWLNWTELQKNILTKGFTPEDTFLRTALWTLQYAVGFEDLGDGNPKSFYGIDQDIKNNLYTGIFPWPIGIKTVVL